MNKKIKILISSILSTGLIASVGSFVSVGCGETAPTIKTNVKVEASRSAIDQKENSSVVTATITNPVGKTKWEIFPKVDGTTLMFKEAPDGASATLSLQHNLPVVGKTYRVSAINNKSIAETVITVWSLVRTLTVTKDNEYVELDKPVMTFTAETNGEVSRVNWKIESVDTQGFWPEQLTFKILEGNKQATLTLKNDVSYTGGVF